MKLDYELEELAVAHGWDITPVAEMPDRLPANGRPTYLNPVIAAMVDNPGVPFRLYYGDKERVSSRRSSLKTAVGRYGLDWDDFDIRSTTNWNKTGQAAIVGQYVGTGR